MKEISDWKKHLSSLELTDDNRQVRLLALLSAAIARCENSLTLEILGFLKKLKIGREAVCETILQSYLFLGFPRMIEAALVFGEVFGESEGRREIEKFSQADAERWFTDGIELCRRVYGRHFETLKAKFISIMPEMFRWMVIEGYGKVLTRSGLTQVERELAEVAALIVDRRERQLVSHVRGSLNVGADAALLRQVNDDIRSISGEEAFHLADDIIRRIQVKYEATK
jgi:alkylhydroperoxidase/carboxymuconolactone decarboxylase family protein YurZ